MMNFQIITARHLVSAHLGVGEGENDFGRVINVDSI
jgi:hypothetical protein